MMWETDKTVGEPAQHKCAQPLACPSLAWEVRRAW